MPAPGDYNGAINLLTEALKLMENGEVKNLVLRARAEIVRATCKIRCAICGELTGGAISASGPYICYSCDCPRTFGNQVLPDVQKPHE